VSIYGVAEHFGIDKSIWVQDVQNRVFSTLGQPNWLAAYLTPLIPISIALLIQKKQKHIMQSILFSSISILYFIVLLFTRSRSGLLAFVIINILFFVWLFFKIKYTQKKYDEKPKKALWIIPFLIVQGVFCLIIFINGTHVDTVDRWITYTGIKNRLMKTTQSAPTPAAIQPTGPVLENGGTDSGIIRSYVWLAAIRAWLSAPKTIAIGTGTETFAFAFYQYKPIAHNLTSEWDFLYNKAHNEYLNYLTTTGIFGLGSYLFLLGVITFWFLTHIRKNFLLKTNKEEKVTAKKMHRHLPVMNTQPTATESEHDLLIMSIFLGWFSILITNFFGFSVVIIQLLLFLLPAIAYILVSEQKHTQHIFSRDLSFSLLGQKIALTVTTILLIALWSGLVILWVADKTFETGYRFDQTGSYAKAYTPLAIATAMIPFEPLYHDEYATNLVTLAVAALQNNDDATLAGTLASHAIAENDASLAISPNNVSYWKTRTKIFYALSSMDSSMISYAIDALEKAQQLSPYDPKIAYNLAVIVGKTGDTDKAISYLLQAKALKTNYRDAYYALYLFYTDKGDKTQATNIIKEYLTTIDSQDEEFKKLVQ
jgi:Ca2+/Na+ antiporter